jgi:hypothetical protein
LFGEDAAGFGGEVEVAGCQVSGGELVDEIGGHGVVERPRHLNDLRQRRRLAAAVAGELANKVDLCGLFGRGGVSGERVGIDGGGRLHWFGVAGLGDFFGEGLGVDRERRCEER